MNIEPADVNYIDELVFIFYILYTYLIKAKLEYKSD